VVSFLLCFLNVASPRNNGVPNASMLDEMILKTGQTNTCSLLLVTVMHNLKAPKLKTKGKSRQWN
jgi:hypothetical protein